MRKAFQGRCNLKDPAGSWPWRTRRAELATSHARAFQTRRWKTHHLRKCFIFQMRKPMGMPVLPLGSRWKQYSGRSYILRQYDKIFLIRPRLYVNHQNSQGNPSTIYRSSSTNQSIPRTKQWEAISSWKVGMWREPRTILMTVKAMKWLRLIIVESYLTIPGI